MNTQARTRDSYESTVSMFYAIEPGDVGRPVVKCFGRTWLVSDFLGRVLPMDVGKRVYLRDGILQAENNAQRDARVSRVVNPSPRELPEDTMTTTTRKTYNGHPSRNYWNVSLWINNDEGLYRFAIGSIRATKTRREAAESMLDGLQHEQYHGIPTTPDGSPYTVASIMHAMRGMER